MADPEALSTGWRCLHSVGACVYLLSAHELYKQRRFPAAALHTCCFVFSVLWSLTRHGGRGSPLNCVDHALAYLNVAYNYSLVCGWGKPNLLLTKKERHHRWENDQKAGWTTEQTRGFLICHMAAVIFFSEDLLRERYGVPVWISYGVIHFIWRLMGGFGGLLIVRGSWPLAMRAGVTFSLGRSPRS